VGEERSMEGTREVLLASPTLNPTLNYRCKKKRRREREEKEKREEEKREKRSPTVTEKVSVK
jgi:hypothetical protein